MGYLVQGRCHATLLEAQDALYTSSVPTLTGGNPQFLNMFHRVDDQWYASVFETRGGWVEISRIGVGHPYGYVTCDPSFDYAQASAIFAFFFSFVVGTWFVSKNIGLIVNAVRRF